MTPPGTFDRVYAAIKQRLRAGLYRPGIRLEPAILAEELNASVTPVRDALHRLTGERLVEAPRHEGFRAPMLTEALLRQLYEWHLDLLLLAVMKHRISPSADEIAVTGTGGGEAAYQRQAALFTLLARCSGNPELAAAFEALDCRLEPARRLEESLLSETETETCDIIRALEADDRKALRLSLNRYHRRRQRVVPELVARLQQA